jgi:hypothetical protein
MMPHDKYVGMLLFIPLDSTTLNSDHEMKRILVFRRLYVRACARERERTTCLVFMQVLMKVI